MYEGSTSRSVRPGRHPGPAAGAIRTASLLLVLSLLGIPRGGHAQDPAAADAAAASAPKKDDPSDEIDRLNEAANKYFQERQYERAVREWQLAYQLDSEQAIFLFNIAQSYRRGGKPREARRYFETYLEKDPHTSLRNETRNYIAELNTFIELEDQRERERRRPVWKKGWFWGVLGTAVVATGVSLGVGLGYGLRDTRQVVDFTFGALQLTLGSPAK